MTTVKAVGWVVLVMAVVGRTVVARVFAKLLRWRLRGDHKRSPLFDAATGAPLAVPRVLGVEERAELMRRCAEWRRGDLRARATQTAPPASAWCRAPPRRRTGSCPARPRPATRT